MPLGIYRLNGIAARLTAGFQPFLLESSNVSSLSGGVVIEFDATGNMFLLFNSSISDSNRRLTVVKTDANGAILWQRKYGNTIYPISPVSLQVLPNGTVAVGWHNGGNVSGVAILNAADGAVLHRAATSISAGSDQSGHGVGYDPANSTAWTLTYNNNQARIIFNRLTSSGGGAFYGYQKGGGSSPLNFSSAVYADKTYWAAYGYIGGSSGSQGLHLSTFSGTGISLRACYNTSGGTPSGMLVDSANNVYIGVGGNNIIKTNSSGAQQWRQSISGATFTNNRFAADGANLYFTATSGGVVYVVCLSASNGSLVWQRRILSVGKELTSTGGNLTINGSELRLAFRNSSDTRAVVLCVPSDGSGTGFYGNYAYDTTTQITATSASVYPTLSSYFDSSPIGLTTDNTAFNTMTPSISVTKNDRVPILTRIPSAISGNTPTYSAARFSNGHIWNTTNGTKTITLPSTIASNSDWTVEFWAFFSAGTNRSFPIRVGTGWYWMIDGNQSYITNNTGNFTILHNGGPTITTGSWRHIAFVYTGANNRVQIYNNGSAGYNFTRSTALPTIQIGRMPSDFVNSTDRQHRIDEIRISNNARYTANFTAPTTAFTNDANTVALFHCQSDAETDDVA